MKAKQLKVLACLAGISLVLTTSAYGAVGLQSKPGTKAKVRTNANDFYKLIRDMEAEGGVMGLSATFAVADNTYKETSISNNIDVHMCKNTEWGTAGMLAMSQYGSGAISSAPQSNTDAGELNTTTTGNGYGIYGMYRGAGSYEHVAGVIKEVTSNFSYWPYLKYADNDHVNNYKNSSSSDMSQASNRYINGDGTYETLKVSGGGGSFVYSSGPVFMRGVNGVLNSSDGTANRHENIGSRTCVVVGAGL